MEWYAIDKNYVSYLKEYDKFVQDKPDSTLAKRCCNFNLLEEKCIKYIMRQYIITANKKILNKNKTFLIFTVCTLQGQKYNIKCIQILITHVYIKYENENIIEL